MSKFIEHMALAFVTRIRAWEPMAPSETHGLSVEATLRNAIRCVFVRFDLFVYIQLCICTIVLI